MALFDKYHKQTERVGQGQVAGIVTCTKLHLCHIEAGARAFVLLNGAWFQVSDAIKKMLKGLHFDAQKRCK